MECAGRQPPQVLRRLTPARAVNMQHNRSELKWTPDLGPGA
jgi:hypothetical protein